jgi:agmatinase
MAIDPTLRWRQFGEKPDYAGLLSFAGVPYTEDPHDLADFDVAVVGAPMDELVSDRPGARLGPRAIRAASCPAGRHLDAEINPFEELAIADFGDAPVVPGDPVQSHAAIEHTIAQVLDVAAMPIVLGGDHSVTEPVLRACSQQFGSLGLIHFDAHTDTAAHVVGASLSHGTWARRLLEEGLVDPLRYVQIGLRGYWPPAEVMEWQHNLGVTSYRVSDIRNTGFEDVVENVVETVGSGPVFLSIDIDALDPAYAPGTGTPEPGGLRSDELLLATRTLATLLDIVGADLVEVAPTDSGGRDPTALVADRVLRELLVGIAKSNHPGGRHQLRLPDAAPAPDRV